MKVSTCQKKKNPKITSTKSTAKYCKSGATQAGKNEREEKV